MGRRLTALCLIAVMLANQLGAVARADEMADRAAEAQAFGSGLMFDPSTMRLGAGDIVEFDDPAIEPGSAISVETLFPGATGSGDADALRSLFGDDAALREEAYRAGDTAGEAETPHGDAWGVGEATRETAPYEIGSDPIYDTLRTLNEASRVSAEFEACQPVLTHGTPTIDTHTFYERRSCTRIAPPTGSHTTDQVVVSDLLGLTRSTRVSGTAESVTVSFGSAERYCGPGRDNNIRFDGASTSSSRTSVRVTQAPTCDNDLTLRGALSGDTCYQRQVEVTDTSVDPPITTTELVTTCPRYTVRANFTAERIDGSTWTPEEVSLGFVDLEANDCVPAYTSRNPGCLPTRIGEICPGDTVLQATLAPPPFDPAYDRFAPLTRSITGDVSACLPVAHANDACAPVEADAVCERIASRLIEETPDPSHRAFEDIYRCAVEERVETPSTEHGLICPAIDASGIRGQGEEFYQPVYETNTSFNAVASHLTATKFTAMDMDCGTADAPVADPAQCEIYKGQAQSCKIAVFGLQNCCESPGGVSLASYMSLAFRVADLESSLGLLESSDTIRGAWELVSSPFAQATSFISTNFASAFNSVAGTEVLNVSDVAAEGLKAAIGDALVKQAAEWTLELFGEAAVNALFTSASSATGSAVTAAGTIATDVALGTALSAVASVISVVMIVYTVYKIVELLIQIIWPCTDQELDLAIKRDLKSCHFNGTYCRRKVLGVCLVRAKGYCCFSSPLTRIMQEEIRRTNGISWGSAKRPQCHGFTPAQFNDLDLTEINLDEWTDILLDTGAMPDGTDFGLEGLTGEGRNITQSMPAGVERLDALDRTAGRTGQIDAEGIEREAREDLREAND
ncbi:MAG: conjugal transfer protein TraN [Pseudomonadota bacterium]